MWWWWSQEKAKEIHLLDGKVLQNAGIALAKYKMAPPDLVKAILAMDDKLFGREGRGHTQAGRQPADRSTNHLLFRPRQTSRDAGTVLVLSLAGSFLLACMLWWCWSDFDGVKTLHTVAPTNEDMAALKEYDGEVAALGKVSQHTQPRLRPHLP